MSWGRVENQEGIRAGDQVRVLIKTSRARRLPLSPKFRRQPQVQAAEKYAVGNIVLRVATYDRFGVFVELEPGGRTPSCIPDCGEHVEKPADAEDHEEIEARSLI